MDFFERQEIARRNTRWLIVYFAIAVAAIVLSVHLLAASIYYYAEMERMEAPFERALLNGTLFGWVALGTLTVIFFGSLFKTLQLAGGGSAVAELLLAQPVLSNTTDPAERRLLHVVEEMAIASGTPMPLVCVLPYSETINALAAGHSTDDMALCVTRGALGSLTRDELQGVVAHEFSHILNGDMRLNLRLMGILFGILCIALIGRILMRSGSSGGGKKGNALPFAGLALFLIGYLGVFFGRLIKSAVSREREYLADAAAVQFTRNPTGLANALKKVGTAGSIVHNPNAEEASHLFFANGLDDLTSWCFATHPPLEERIRELDPHWDGKFLSSRRTELDLVAEQHRPKPNRPPAAALPGTFLQAGILAAGTATPSHIDYAAGLIDALPEPLVAAAREPLGACALVYALLLSGESAVRDRQNARLAVDPPLWAELQRIASPLATLERRARLPLLTLALPALRQLSAAQYAHFNQTLDALIAEDGQIDLFEFMLQKILHRRLAPHYGPAVPERVEYTTLKPLLGDAAVLLSALAHCGHADPGLVRAAYLRGAQELPFEPGSLQPLEAERSGIEAIDNALNRVNRAAAPIKKLILDACAQTVVADSTIDPNEAELLRAIADALGCPLPPFIQLEG